MEVVTISQKDDGEIIVEFFESLNKFKIAVVESNGRESEVNLDRYNMRRLMDALAELIL